MKIGYCRVSTDDQNPALQLAALKKAGCQNIYTDKATGAHTRRPELAKCLKPILTAQQVAHARKLREQGESPKAIAKLLTVSVRTLQRAL